MNTETIEAPVAKTPDGQQLITRAEMTLDIAREFTIDSAAMYEASADELRSIKKRVKELEDTRMAMTRPLDESKKRIMDLFRKPLEILQEAESVIKTSRLKFERAEAERQRKLQAEAAAAAAAERARLQAEADAAAAAAAEAQAQGDVEMAASMQVQAEVAQATAEVVVAPTISTLPAKSAGISKRKQWGAEVYDLQELVKFVAERPDLIGLLLPNQKALNDMAKALKDGMSIPGVRATDKEIVSVRM